MTDYYVWDDALHNERQEIVWMDDNPNGALRSRTCFALYITSTEEHIKIKITLSGDIMTVRAETLGGRLKSGITVDRAEVDIHNYRLTALNIIIPAVDSGVVLVTAAPPIEEIPETLPLF